MAAAVLAALGTMLTLVPLAAIAQIASDALAGVKSDVWRVLGVSLGAMFVGMALVFAGELLAHIFQLIAQAAS